MYARIYLRTTVRDQAERKTEDDISGIFPLSHQHLNKCNQKDRVAFFA